MRDRSYKKTEIGPVVSRHIKKKEIEFGPCLKLWSFTPLPGKQYLYGRFRKYQGDEDSEFDITLAYRADKRFKPYYGG